MMAHNSQIQIGDCVYRRGGDQVEGGYVTVLGERYYCIRNYDQMPPFFMNIVSSSDLWLYISSTGGLSAGRRNAESALFPYYTVDKITENHVNTGNKAVLLVSKGERTWLWEPFSSKYAGVYRIERNLYKNVYGNKLVFEEINHNLGLNYRYAWRTSDRFGFVKTTWLENGSTSHCSVSLVDGLQNLLPYGATTALQTTFSNLLNAYKRSELETETGLGIFSLSSTLTDLAEPSESLQATTVWQVGIENARYLLSTRQLADLRSGLDIVQESDVRGYRGAYLVNSEFELDCGAEKSWSIVAEVNQDSCAVASLVHMLRGGRDELGAQLERDIDKCSDNLVEIVARADCLQLTGDDLATAHHFANVLFNNMRGGIFADNQMVSKADLCDFAVTRNRVVWNSQQEFFAALPEKVDVDGLLAQAAATRSKDLERLCYEYLPLTFSRRHGDPSRPWNQFSINVKDADGSTRLDYQGNWRDIFQNWEPLVCSYPGFIEGVICKFLNATTVDGYNPYRITRDGIEWEVPAPEDPWANIGYWSDHQIVYLLKLLEISARYHPGRLQSMLDRKVFCHANVPYRIKKYAALLQDPYDTILFDRELEDKIQDIVGRMGADGKLVLDASDRVFHVGLAEKLLVLLLAKLFNFVPEGGIWMNTQRPEWNDANNALVGKGLSVVTLCYLRRFIAFYQGLLSSSELEEVEVEEEVRAAFDAVYGVLEKHRSALGGSFDERERRTVMDELGQAGSDYRWHYYEEGLSGRFSGLHRGTLLGFLGLAQEYVEHTLGANERSDHLYHAYNILHLGPGKASVDYLYEMLEGQVAILSSGMLSGVQSLALLQSLRTSGMYRADQHSYMLYPDRDLPGFLHKNRLSLEQVKGSALIARLVEQGNRELILRDENGVYHFEGGFRNARDVEQALSTLSRDARYAALIEAEKDVILDLFEETFDHSAFTGRSGTFFAYEGLGSIYWHMVSKLLLAVQETFLRVVEQKGDEGTVQALADIYYDVRRGIGFNKTPDVYGAFPTDPYSHTPAAQGAKQPGMTGQVKEELVTRLGEMGVSVEHGRLALRPVLLRQQEFLSKDARFEYVDLDGTKQTIELSAGSLAFTFCQVPVVYVSFDKSQIVVDYADGRSCEVDGQMLDVETSRHIFDRDGEIKKLTVYTRAML